MISRKKLKKIRKRARKVPLRLWTGPLGKFLYELTVNVLANLIASFILR
jgi:hypothetical protein